MEPPQKSTSADLTMDANDVNSLAMSGTVQSTSQPTKNGTLDRKTTGKHDTSTPSETSMHEQALQRQNQSLTPSGESASKRKTSPVTVDGHVEKRQRRASTDMDVDTMSERKHFLSASHYLCLISLTSYSCKTENTCSGPRNIRPIRRRENLFETICAASRAR